MLELPGLCAFFTRNDALPIYFLAILTVPDMSHLRESNPRPTIYETVALPTELRWLKHSEKSRANIIFLTENHKD